MLDKLFDDTLLKSHALILTKNTVEGSTKICFHLKERNGTCLDVKLILEVPNEPGPLVLVYSNERQHKFIWLHLLFR